MIDLHLHSNVTSPDGGQEPPESIVNEAKRIGLTALALTDHDSVKGIREASRRAEEIGILFVPGIEIACNFQKLSIEVVGLGIDEKIMDRFVKKSPAQIQKEKRAAGWRLFVRAGEVGLAIPSLSAETLDSSPDIAHEIISSGYQVESNREVCQRLTGTYPVSEDLFYQLLFAPGCPASVVNDLLPLAEALRFIKESGGKSFLAHPKRADGLLANLTDEFISKVIEAPIDGLECLHSKTMPKDSANLIELCRDRQLLMTGGSDAHSVSVMESWNERLRVPDEFLTWYSGSGNS
jgi:predicted metal-dependent phosphoesterase TrpH